MYGYVEATDLHSRKTVSVVAAKVAAITPISSNGFPTRLLFDGGGFVDVCGCADIWRLEIALELLRWRTE